MDYSLKGSQQQWVIECTVTEMQIAGMLAYLILVFVFGPPLSGWLILPLGIATIAALLGIGSRKAKPLPKEQVGDGVNVGAKTHAEVLQNRGKIPAPSHGSPGAHPLSGGYRPFAAPAKPPGEIAGPKK